MGLVVPKTPKKKDNRAAKNLRAIRDRWHFSVADMALALGARQNTLTTWENEGRGTTTESLRPVARALGCKPGDLINDQPPELDEIPPMFGFAIIDEGAADESDIESVRQAVAKANESHRLRIRLAQANATIDQGRHERGADLAPKGKAGSRRSGKGAS